MTLKRIGKDELESILERHWKWLRDEEGGKRADLYRSNLSGSNLSGSNLSGSNLSGSDLSMSDLSRCDLSRCDLSRCDLSRCDLSRCDLSRSDLSGSNLYMSNLSGSDLSRSNLSRSNLSWSNLSWSNLSGSKFLAHGWTVLQVLQANWGNLPRYLTIEMMKWDVLLSSPDMHDRFARWKKDGICPFSTKRYGRSLMFVEQKDIYRSGKLKYTLWELLMKLFKTKKIKYEEGGGNNERNIRSI